MSLKGYWASLVLFPMWPHCLHPLCLFPWLMWLCWFDYWGWMARPDLGYRLWCPSSITKWWPPFGGGGLLPFSVRCSWMEKKDENSQPQPNHFIPRTFLILPLQQQQHHHLLFTFTLVKQRKANNPPASTSQMLGFRYVPHLTQLYF